MGSGRVERTVKYGLIGAILALIFNWARSNLAVLMSVLGGLTLFMIVGVGASKAVNFVVMPFTGHPVMGVRHTAWGDKHIRFDNGRVGLGGKEGGDIVITGTVYNQSPWAMSDIGIECNAFVSYTDLGETDRFFGYYEGDKPMYAADGKLVEGLTKGEIPPHTEAKITLRVKSAGGYIDPGFKTISCRFQNYKLH